MVRDSLASVALERDIKCINPVEFLVDDQGLLSKEYSTDGVHLTDSAYDVLGKNIIKEWHLK